MSSSGTLTFCNSQPFYYIFTLPGQDRQVVSTCLRQRVRGPGGGGLAET